VIGRVVTAAVALAAAALALGCGQGEPDSSAKFKGEEKLVANTIEDLQTAGEKDDAGRICNELLTAKVVAAIRQAGAKTCAATIEDSLDDADSFELTVKAVTVRGTTATATVLSDDGSEKDRTDTMTLVKEGRRWKISTLGS
jgi:hypothetical protein